MILSNFLDKLPPNNAIAVGHMLNALFDNDIEFIKEHLITGAILPGNIIYNINKAFKDTGFPQYNWENCSIDTRNKVFDGWLDEV